MIRLRCPKCRKLLEGRAELVGARCPYCETGQLEHMPVVTPELMAEAETAVGFEEWAS